ncbi:MAG TPA: hypothetical protein PLE61_00125 [Vicinamibacterales bacterium]|nr:hypothetical protein [Vicinamibacterales bacterium]HPW19193.1 hypothetical protein [Vicinamibacterales bacterium]
MTRRISCLPLSVAAAVVLMWAGAAHRNTAAQAVIQADISELPRRVAELEAAKAAERAKLQASRSGTQEAYRAIDDKYLGEARKLHQSVREPQLRALERASGVQRGTLSQGAAGTAPELGRGAFGDVDTGSLGARQFEAVRQAALKAGYTVQGEGDYFTIKELGTTVHREPTLYASAPGSSARQAEISRGLGHETSYNVGSARADANVAALKNLEKGGHTLDRPAARLMESPADLQELGKMTQRNMEAGGVRNQALEAQVDMLKTGYSPEAAGIVRPNATAAEKAATLGEFQQQCRDVNAQSVRNTQARSAATMEGLQAAARAAEAKLQQARASGNAEAISSARAEVQAARTEAIEFQAQQRAAREALVRNNPEGARLMAEAQGMKADLVNGPGGPRYRTPQGTKTPSQLVDALTEPPLPGGQPKASWVSRGLNGVGVTLMGFGIYQGVKDAQEQAGREAGERGDGALTSAAKLGAYSVWNSLGFAWAVQSGREGQARSMQQYQDDLKAGRVDSMSFTSFMAARARGVGDGLYQFLGFKGIETAYAEYVNSRAEQALAAANEKAAATALARDQQRNLERAAARAASEKAAAEKAAAEQAAARNAAQESAARAGSGRSSGETAAAAKRPAPKPASPPQPKSDDASVMPNLVRTSWSGQITMQPEEGPAVVLPLTVAIDSYNKISGSLRWSAWFDEQENQRLLDLSGSYDSRTGALTMQADRVFTEESTITQVLSVPTGSGMGTEQKRVEVKETRRAGVKVRAAGAIDGPDAARGNLEISLTNEILVDGASQGADTNVLRGTWRLNRRR